LSAPLVNANEQVTSQQTTDQLIQNEVDAVVVEENEHDDPNANKLNNREFNVRLMEIGNYRASGLKAVYGIKGPYSVEFKIQYGRRRIQYQIDDKPPNKYRMDIRFESISRLSVGTTTLSNQGKELDSDVPLLEIELIQPPSFSVYKDSKFIKTEDFTGGQASHHKLHSLCFHTKRETLFNAVRQLLEFCPSIMESDESIRDSTFSNDIPICTNDEENVALVHCEDCNENFCKECDDVLHRNLKKKNHKRKPMALPVSQPLTPPQEPSPTQSLLPIQSSLPSPPPRTERPSYVGACRCGSGGKKAQHTVCTSKRCPCYAANSGCLNCGCKSACDNPYGTHERSQKKQKLEDGEGVETTEELNSSLDTSITTSIHNSSMVNANDSSLNGSMQVDAPTLVPLTDSQNPLLLLDSLAQKQLQIPVGLPPPQIN